MHRPIRAVAVLTDSAMIQWDGVSGACRPPLGGAHGRRCGGRLGRKFERNLNERRRRRRRPRLRLRNMAKMIVGFLLFISPAFPVGPSRMELQAEVWPATRGEVKCLPAGRSKKSEASATALGRD
ncbi:hypothetical protein chiPu_0031394 [Chiloscyllium punctatum]|uniref:Uncharacterized protein n=1 Tax=Chiloscyllium punctatum TaxID=137246 RepID=A0A401TX68_CHIPU|nr:hypothetical protein [Chiloscyllium punctatum]